jgi:hypothetical protein
MYMYFVIVVVVVVVIVCLFGWTTLAMVLIPLLQQFAYCWVCVYVCWRLSKELQRERFH